MTTTQRIREIKRAMRTATGTRYMHLFALLHSLQS